MTNEELRKLDADLAEKVMGWKRDKGFLLPPDDHQATINHWAAEWDEEGRPHWLPFYSTDISAAWEVVEKFPAMQLFKYTTGTWVCCWGAEGKLFEAEADTAPLAICLVALKAVGS